MNCPECKHPIESHTDGCLHRLPSPYGWVYCGCSAVEAPSAEELLENELDKFRAYAAWVENCYPNMGYEDFLKHVASSEEHEQP